jgi:hypothetical protein
LKTPNAWPASNVSLARASWLNVAPFACSALMTRARSTCPA